MASTAKQSASKNFIFIQWVSQQNVLVMRMRTCWNIYLVWLFIITHPMFNLIFCTYHTYNNLRVLYTSSKSLYQFCGLTKLTLHFGVAGLSGDTTVVLPVTGHQDISLISPLRPPAVLHDVVLLEELLSAVANSQHTMVQLG